MREVNEVQVAVFGQLPTEFRLYVKESQIGRSAQISLYTERGWGKESRFFHLPCNRIARCKSSKTLSILGMFPGQSTKKFALVTHVCTGEDSQRPELCRWLGQLAQLGVRDYCKCTKWGDQLGFRNIPKQKKRRLKNSFHTTVFRRKSPNLWLSIQSEILKCKMLSLIILIKWSALSFMTHEIAIN